VPGCSTVRVIFADFANGAGCQDIDQVLLYGDHFLCGISHTLLSRANFICRREQSVCHVLSTWREDWVPLAKSLCSGIPFSVITLMTLLFIGYCFMAHFDLVLRLGGSLRS